jgi:hypothetical protein
MKLSIPLLLVPIAGVLAVFACSSGDDVSASTPAALSAPAPAPPASATPAGLPDPAPADAPEPAPTPEEVAAFHAPVPK